jgi:hypothetical protein
VISRPFLLAVLGPLFAAASQAAAPAPIRHSPANATTAAAIPPTLDDAVARGLEYLAKQQGDDGSIVAEIPPAPSTTTTTTTATAATTTATTTATAPTSGPSTSPTTAPLSKSPTVADTSAALLAFLAAGHTPDVGRYGLVVRGAIDFLVDHASDDTNGLPALALAEAYGVDQHAASRQRIRGTLSKMLPVVLKATMDAKKPDPAIARWNALALSACRDIGLAVPDAAIPDAIAETPSPSLESIIKAQSSDGGWPATANDPGRSYTTAIALLTLTQTYHLLPLDTRG